MSGRRKKKKRNKGGYDKHHIIPKSRGGSEDAQNIINVLITRHRAYHALFNNALPEEAIKILIEDWFYKDGLKDSKLYELILYLENLRSANT